MLKRKKKKSKENMCIFKLKSKKIKFRGENNWAKYSEFENFKNAFFRY